MSIDYSERELIQRAIRMKKPEHGIDVGTPRWVLVKRIFGTGQTVSQLICLKYGFDPDKEV